MFELLTENGLGDFYGLGNAVGIRVAEKATGEQFKFLDEPAVRACLANFADERTTRVTLRVPAIHCIACVWLLENLFRLQSGIGPSQVDFLRKEIVISFETEKVKMSEVVALLASLGYEPELRLSDLEDRTKPRGRQRLWLQVGNAGFAFGNIMLFSLSSYFGLDSFSGASARQMFGYFSLVLSLPVVLFSARDYWRSAWVSLRQRRFNIDVPIAAGIAALFGQSTYEVLTGQGEGYFDSLAGLLFFLLCGKLFQQKTYERLAFDRDYKSLFPLSVIRTKTRPGCNLPDEARANSKLRGLNSEEHQSLLTSAATNDAWEERVSLAAIQAGDRLLIRNREIVPADARLVEGAAFIDYSFVTGESELIAKKTGDHLYAGGRQMGGVIEIEILKAVSQSYLTSLWNQEVFRKERGESLNTLTNRYSQRFTKIIMAIAVGAAGFWAFENPTLSLKAFTSVLIVACPCALALAAPFALGTAQRVLARRNVFLKNPYVLEALASANTVVFDKTGTLTEAGTGFITWHGPSLTSVEERSLCSIARHSTHPLSVRIREALNRNGAGDPVEFFHETPGCGIGGRVGQRDIRMGSAAWLVPDSSRREEAPTSAKCKSTEPPDVGCYEPGIGSTVHVSIDGKDRGYFLLSSALRPETEKLIYNLSGQYELALLSGDNDKDRQRLSALFGASTNLHFNQSALDKLDYVRALQKEGKSVIMVGDGLNDAGALKQSDVGVAVVEQIAAFSPASDVIATAATLPHLANLLRYAKHSVRVVRAAFLISTLYNIIGLSIAASGRLSPIVCAILMPLSSVSVVAFACGLTTWLGRRIGFDKRSDQIKTLKPTS